MDEPRNHPIFMLLLALAALASVPVLFVGQPLVLWWGIPLWLWWSAGATLALSLLTSWGFARYWTDGEDSEEGIQEERDD
jgi:membrane protein implicated in regulation of membrane protease activity